MTNFKHITQTSLQCSPKQHRQTSNAFIFKTIMLCLLAQACMGTFSGDIDMSSTVIGDTDVTYTFNLSFQQEIEDNGKLVIRFPSDFVQQFSVTSCAGVSGLAEPDDLSCSYVPDVRILTITNCFPTTFTEMSFTVSGVENPPYAAITQHFTVNSYRKSGSSWVPVESSGSTITITPTAGALSNERLDLAD